MLITRRTTRFIPHYVLAYSFTFVWWCVITIYCDFRCNGCHIGMMIRHRILHESRVNQTHRMRQTDPHASTLFNR